jgi:hypothetical protein
MVNAISYVIFYACLIYLFSCMVYCLFPNLNGWMYVCLHSHRERSGWRARRTRRRSPWATISWWRQVSLDLSLSYSFFNSPPHYTFMPKDWLAFVIHILVYLLGSDYYWLALCYCLTLINGHDENYLWYAVFPSFIMMLYLWPSRGLERFLECLSVRTSSLDDRPGKQCNHEGGVGRP